MESIVHMGPSLDILMTLDDNSVDCVITDPPYTGFEGMESHASYCDWFEPHFREMKRVCRDEERIIVSQLPARHKLFKERFKFLTGMKVGDAMQGKRGHDAFFLGLSKTVPESLPGIEDWAEDIVPASTHPNDRNIGKMSVVVKAMSDRGETVLDPFCGSAAIGVACVLLGRNYIGIELMKDRAQDAKRRLNAATAYRSAGTRP